MLLLIASAALIFASCSGDASKEATSESETATQTTPGDTGESDAQNQQTSTVEPGESETPITDKGELAEIANGFVFQYFAHEASESEQGCLNGQIDSRAEVLSGLQNYASNTVDLNDGDIHALTTASAACIDSAALGAWASSSIGFTDEHAERASACFAEQFSDEALGQQRVANLASLKHQFRLDPATTGDLKDMLSSCAPVDALAGVFASQATLQGGSNLVVDQECLAESLDDAKHTRAFWTTLVDGTDVPLNLFTTQIQECTKNPNADLAAEIPSDFEPWAGTGELAKVRPEARMNAYSERPPMLIDPSKNYEAVITTGGGEIRFKLFADTAPVTVNNFVSLARDGFYDRTTFHRVLVNFMAQGGDPSGTGSGGPGYAFEDEFESDRAFDKPGILAMANSGPASNGSQFFITFAPTEWLTGSHTIFGEVVEGDDVLFAIELRDPASAGAPGQLIESITIIEN